MMARVKVNLMDMCFDIVQTRDRNGCFSMALGGYSPAQDPVLMPYCINFAMINLKVIGNPLLVAKADITKHLYGIAPVFLYLGAYHVSETIMTKRAEKETPKLMINSYIASAIAFTLWPTIQLKQRWQIYYFLFKNESLSKDHRELKVKTMQTSNETSKLMANFILGKFSCILT
ncbi:hypothetical protein RRG08_025741 [Elysia crispata]|uniref:Uncharacterized protein n=1 Tax=Elysia crispata TaxID=231223 RepID=A0AAE1AGI8_9GAST|nr:hypothetical protein RRG08_025741 [Elysia crispata]